MTTINRIAILFLLLGICGGVLYHRWTSVAPKQFKRSIPGHYFEAVPITWINHLEPCIDICIEEHTIPVLIDLGFSGCLQLPNTQFSCLNNKSLKRTTSYCGIRGKKYDSELYELLHVQIGHFRIYHPTAENSSQEFESDSILFQNPQSIAKKSIGRIGWHAFANFNVLLDFNRDQLAFCDSLATLQKNGYPVEQFVAIPLRLYQGLLTFQARTSHGTLNCLLDTGATLNYLNQKIDSQSKVHRIFSDTSNHPHALLNPDNIDLMIYNSDQTADMISLAIGQHDFGVVRFHPIQIPLDIDAIIGMNFFNGKCLFIDFSHEKIYILPEPP